MKSDKLLVYAIIFLILSSLSFSQQSDRHLVKLVELNSCGISIFPHIKNNILEVDLNYGFTWLTEDVYEVENQNKFVELKIEYCIYFVGSKKEISNNRFEYIEPIINKGKSYQQYVNKVTHALPINDYLVELKIKNLLTKENLNKRLVLQYNPNNESRLYLSSLLFASEIKEFKPGQDTTFKQDSLYVVPYPFQAINKKELIFCYFEIDNISLNNTLKYSYQVKYQLLWNKKSLFAIPKKKKMISSSYVAVSSTKFNQEYFSIDFSNIKNGKYKLTINVKDLTTKKSKSIDIKFDLKG